MRGLLIIVLLLSFFSGMTKNPTKELPLWVTKSYRDSIYPATHYFVKYLTRSEVKSKNVKEEKLALIDGLKKQLIQNIATSVSSAVKYEVKENQTDGFSETLEVETQLKSKLNLYDTKPQVFFQKNTQTLYGLLVLNKHDFGIKLFANSQTKLSVLNKELSWYNKKVSARALQKDLESFNQRMDDLEINWQVLISLGIEPNDELTTSMAEVRNKITDLYGVLYSAENERMIQDAQQYLANEEYDKALKAFQLAKVKLPDDKRIVEGIALTSKDLEQQFVAAVHSLQNQKKYNQALAQFDLLFALIPNLKVQYLKAYEELKTEAFDKYSKKVELALKEGNVLEIDMTLLELEPYLYVNKDKYNKYKQKAEKVRAEHYYTLAKFEYNNGLYANAINEVNKALRIEGDNSNYIDLRKDAQYKIYRIQLRELKKTRPHVYSVQWGAGVQNQHALFKEGMENDAWDVNLLPSFSIGLYRKINVKPLVNSSGRDKSKANLMGVQYNYLFQQIAYSFNEKGIVKNPFLNAHELNLVIGFKHKYQFKLGVLTSQVPMLLEQVELSQLSVALTRQYYMQPVALDFEIKVYIDRDGNVSPVLKMTFNINTNLKRRMSFSDRKELKYRINQKY